MSISKKKKKVYFPSKEVSEAEEETKPPEVFSSISVSNKSPSLSKKGSQEISRKGSNRNLDSMNSKFAKSTNFRRILKSIGSENHDPINVNNVENYVEDEDIGIKSKMTISEFVKSNK